MCHQQRQQHNNRKQEPIQHHMRDAHLRQRNLAEEKAAPPKTTSRRTRRKPQRPSLLQNRHTSTLAQKNGREPKPSPTAKFSNSLLTTHCLYHARQLFAGTIGEPFLQPNAPANPGWFTIAPFARK